MFKKIQSEHGRLDVCINNAGLSCDSSLLTGKTEDWKQMLDVILCHNIVFNQGFQSWNKFIFCQTFYTSLLLRVFDPSKIWDNNQLKCVYTCII